MKSYLSLFIISADTADTAPIVIYLNSLIPRSWRIRKIFVVKSIAYAPPDKMESSTDLIRFKVAQSTLP